VALSTREKYIAIGVGAVVALAGLDRLVIDPFMEQGQEITNKRLDVGTKLSQADTMFNRRLALRHVWSDMRTVGGLISDSTETENQTEKTLQDWAQASGVRLTSLSGKHVAQPNVDRKSDKPEAKFEQIAVDATGAGSMAAITRFLWKLESAPKLLKISEIHVTPRKEGTDDLQVQVTVTTVSLIPDPTPADRGADNGHPVANAGAGLQP
jgi:type II secretory pathway component PulM